MNEERCQHCGMVKRDTIDPEWELSKFQDFIRNKKDGSYRFVCVCGEYYRGL